MALDKIRKANKKARHEHKRKLVRADIGHTKQQKKVQRKRARDMFIQGRKEYQAKRRADKAYLAALEAELANEQ